MTSSFSFGLFAVVERLGLANSLLSTRFRSFVDGVVQQVDKPALDGASIDLTTWPMSSCRILGKARAYCCIDSRAEDAGRQ